MALTNLSSSLIQDTYPRLLQQEGGFVADGSGSAVDLLRVTASYANSALSASHALFADNAENAVTASYALNVDPIATGSFMTTGSISGATITFTKGDSSTFDIVVPDTDVSALNAFTASADLRLDALETETGSLQSQIDSLTGGTGSYATVAELNASSSALISGYTAADNALSSSLASALTSEYQAADTALSGALAIDIANNASDIATNASNISTNAGNIATNAAAIDGIEAQTGSYARTDQNNSFTGEQTFNDIIVNGTGSFAYIQQVTGSAKIIGDAYIILNNDTPAERFAGLVVQDSGSAGVTASLEFDGLYNDWFYEYSDDGGVTTDHGVVLFGPEYNTKGVPTYPSNNTIQKGMGGHHLLDSSITDDGVSVDVGLPLNVTGAVSASSFIGDGSGLTGVVSTLSASVETGNIKFANIAGEIYGSAVSPITTNLIVDNTNAIDGSVAIIYHTAATEPTITGATINKSVGNYESGSLNIITLTNIDGTNILRYTAGGEITTVATASYALTAATASYLSGGVPHTEGLIEGHGTDSAEMYFSPTLKAQASGSGAVAIGKNAEARQFGGTALGEGAISDGFQATALGTQAKAEAGGALSMGAYATNRAQDGITLGNLAEGEGGTGPIAIGRAARGYGNYSIAIGYGAGTTYNFADQVVIGANSTSTGINEIILGANATSHGANTVTIGNSSITATHIEGQINNSGLSYPTADGTANQVLATDGLGNLSFASVGGLPLEVTDGTTSVTNVDKITFAQGEVVSGGSGDTTVQKLIDTTTDTYTGTSALEHVITLTQVEYDAIGTPDANTLYVIV